MPESDPLKVLFTDISESSTGATVVAFQKGQLKVLGAAYDPNLGGRNFDDVLLEHFAKEFKVFYLADAWWLFCFGLSSSSFHSQLQIYFLFFLFRLL